MSVVEVEPFPNAYINSMVVNKQTVWMVENLLSVMLDGGDRVHLAIDT